MANSHEPLRPGPGDLDPLIHERLRLGLLSALAVQPELSFTELRDLLATTDGNLSVHARKLEEAGFIVCQKQLELRKAKTVYALTERGREALAAYLDTLTEMLPEPAAVRRGPRRDALRPAIT
ncbi:MAG TPA: transcriptional regulator [Limnochordia bacterium]|nr:transcriptional regulator [Limnochordia bacterium]